MYSNRPEYNGLEDKIKMEEDKMTKKKRLDCDGKELTEKEYGSYVFSGKCGALHSQIILKQSAALAKYHSSILKKLEEREND